MSKNNDWINSHAESYAGKWVALSNGVLIASDDTLKALTDWLALAGIPRKAVLFHRMIDAPPTVRGGHAHWLLSDTRGGDASFEFRHSSSSVYLTPERMKQMLRDGVISFT